MTGQLKDPKEGKKAPSVGTSHIRCLGTSPQNLVRSGLPTLSIDEEVSGLPVTKGRKEITDNLRHLIQRLKFEIPILGQGF